MYEITCHYCFEIIPIDLYIEEGKTQNFILDCEVCCHPLEVTASWESEIESFQIDVKEGLG